MDEHAVRIHDLIIDTCVATQPVEALLHIRAELLSDVTGDAEAADAACGAVAEIELAVSAALADVPERRAS
jgi:uncharacterized protein YoxC